MKQKYLKGGKAKGKDLKISYRRAASTLGFVEIMSSEKSSSTKFSKMMKHNLGFFVELVAYSIFTENEVSRYCTLIKKRPTNTHVN